MLVNGYMINAINDALRSLEMDEATVYVYVDTYSTSRFECRVNWSGLGTSTLAEADCYASRIMLACSIARFIESFEMIEDVCYYPSIKLDRAAATALYDSVVPSVKRALVNQDADRFMSALNSLSSIWECQL